MSANLFDIESRGLSLFKNELKKLGRADLPVVARQTLNKAAVDGRNVSLPEVYNKTFVVRSKPFLKNRSRFNLARGLRIDRMESSFGILQKRDRSTRGLVKQEAGGMIQNEFIPLKRARISKSFNRKIRSKKTLTKIAFNRRIKKGDGQKMIKEAYRVGVGGFLLYGDILYEVRGFRRLKNGNSWVNMVPLYNVKSGRRTKINSTNFIENSGKLEAKNLQRNFVFYAESRIKKKKFK